MCTSNHRGTIIRDCDSSLLSLWITIICKWEFIVFNFKLPTCHDTMECLNSDSSKSPPSVILFVFMQCFMNALIENWNKYMEFHFIECQRNKNKWPVRKFLLLLLYLTMAKCYLWNSTEFHREHRPLNGPRTLVPVGELHYDQKWRNKSWSLDVNY